MNAVIKAENLGKKYIIGHQRQPRYQTLRDTMTHTARGVWQRIRHPLSPNRESVDLEELWALKDINFEVQQGERVGIIGRNGAGKSTLLKVLSRITEPTTGKVRIKGRVSSLLEVGTGFHPELTGRENIFLNGAILGMTRQEVKRKFDEIIAFAELEKFLDTPVKRYSSGMYVRLAFAVAAHLEPEILIVDEVLAVGDAAFQKKCFGRMESVAQEGRTVLFVSHNMTVVQVLCDRSILLDSGQITEDGSTPLVIQKYLVVGTKQGEVCFGPGTIRSGNGSARYTRVRLLDEDGKIISSVPMGHRMTIEIEFACYEKINNPSFAVRVVSSLQEGLVGWGTNVTYGEMPPASVGGVVRLRIERIALLPGLYYLILGMSDGHQQVDRIENALQLEIVPWPVYSTGKIPSPGLVKFFTPCSWTHEYR